MWATPPTTQPSCNVHASVAALSERRSLVQRVIDKDEHLEPLLPTSHLAPWKCSGGQSSSGMYYSLRNAAVCFSCAGQHQLLRSASRWLWSCSRENGAQIRPKSLGGLEQLTSEVADKYGLKWGKMVSNGAVMEPK